jgi:uncharacterized membrane protein
MPLGPVQILVLGFEGTDERPEIRAELDRLRESDIIRLVDSIVVRKDENGELDVVQRTDLSQEEATEAGAMAGALIGFGAGEGDEDVALAGAAVGAEAGSDSHLLSEEGVWFIEDAIPNGTTAAVALVEHRWAIPLRDSIRGAGGMLLADAWVHPADLVGIGLLAAEEAEAH